MVPYENEKEIFIKEIFRDLKVKPTKILYIIGAEGGFEKEEIDYLKENGAKIISLGKRILRAETAAIVTGGVIINEFSKKVAFHTLGCKVNQYETEKYKKSNL